MSFKTEDPIISTNWQYRSSICMLPLRFAKPIAMRRVRYRSLSSERLIC